MKEYFERFGAVRDYLRGVVEQAKIDGYTETIFGRRRPFPDLASPNRVLRENAERAALNSPIQGSAADIIKIAMTSVEADIAERELRSRMLLQVHDELVFEVAPGESDVLEEVVARRHGERRRPPGAARRADRPRRELGRRGALTAGRASMPRAASVTGHGTPRGRRGHRRAGRRRGVIGSQHGIE